MSVYIIDAARTPIGKYGGSLSSVRPDDLIAYTIKKLLERNQAISAEWIEEVILGAANQSGEDNRNVARMAVLLAGLPLHIGGVTVNRLCASGLQSIADSFRAIQNGDGELYIAGGVESMSRAPFVVSKSTSSFDRGQEFFDTTMGWRFTNKAFPKEYTFTMGETAENVAREWNISREEQDAFALSSQEKYQKAHEQNKFKDELIAVEVSKGKETFLFEKDEHPRLSTLADLAKLKPAFVKDGTVTAGNSSGINDGAAALILASESFVKKHNITPLVRIVSVASAGVHPATMGIGPVPASQKALQRAGITVNDLSFVELNEAFASQSLASIRDLKLNPEIVNVNGGAIAIGHPLGCSGSRISTTLLHEMKRNPNAKYGLATMCIGVGQGMAIVYEKV
jgi:3-oxoadipyl-CoA thiolase